MLIPFDSSFTQCGLFFVNQKTQSVFFGLGKYQQVALRSQIKSHLAFYLNSVFFENTTPWLEFEKTFICSIHEFLNFLRLFPKICPKFIWTKLDQQSYKQQFNSLQDLITKGLLKKGVPYSSCFAQINLLPEHIFYMIEKSILQNKETLYPFGFWDFQKNIALIGSTPELIFNYSENLIYTKSLAGTIDSKDYININDVFKDDKLMMEHNFVIDDLKLKLHSFGVLKSFKTTLLNVGQISHLSTDMSIVLKDKIFDFEEFIKIIHPSAALGCYPKNQISFNWLKNLDLKSISKRGYYTGVFGFDIKSNKNISESLGIIRSLEWKNGKMSLHVGGGVIYKSTLAQEWIELERKKSSTLVNLGLTKD